MESEPHADQEKIPARDQNLNSTHIGEVVRDSSVIRRVRIMCDLFNMAFEIKSLALERKFPEASPEWIKQETLRLIESGTR